MTDIPGGLKFASSSNGDRWFLIRDGETPYVVHQANDSSGGKVTNFEVGEFLILEPRAPEHRALLLMIASLVESPVSADPAPSEVDAVG